MVYKPKFAAIAREMCRLGATDEELAEHFNVCVRTIYRWRNTHEEFAGAVVAGKEHADARVERALYSRAVGCSVERTRVFKHAGDPKPVYATYKHHLPPDPNAALNWLRVRQPKKWRISEWQTRDPWPSEMIQKALDRIKDHQPPVIPPRQPPPEAATPARPPEPGSESGPEPPPDPQPGPSPAPPPVTSPILPPVPESTVGRVYAPVYAPVRQLPPGF
jgi:hypothetical protein